MSSRHLFFLPGLLLTPAVFTHQINALRTAFPRLNIHTPTLSGHSDLSSWASAFLTTAPKSFSVVGLSLGGYAAMELMRQAPKRIESVSLISTQAKADTANHRQRRLRLIEEAQMFGINQVVTDQIPRLLSPVNQSANAPFASSLYLQARAIGVQQFTEQQHMCSSRKDSREVLSSTSMPALVMCGALDELTPIKCSREIVSALKSDQQRQVSGPIVIDNGGHLITMECPHIVNEFLLKFLRPIMQKESEETTANTYQRISANVNVLAAAAAAADAQRLQRAFA